MLARLVAPALFLTSTAFADCLPDPAVVEAIQSVRDTPCYGIPECLNGQLEEIERVLQERPESIPLHRMRQDLALAAKPLQRESVRGELIEHYRDHPALGSQASRYLVARPDFHEDSLREASEHIPWARLDLMRRQAELDQEALVDADAAEQLLEAFVSECPNASVLLADEARQLLISAHWPVWSEVRRHLLDMEPPPWEHLNKVLIRAGLLQEVEVDPAERLLAELDATTGDRYRSTAGYWLYRSRIHFEARDVDAALEANARAREIDICQQLSPLQRIRPDEAGEFKADWLAGVSEQVLNCPPNFETYQHWLIAVTQQPELLEPAPLARIRRSVESRALGHNTLRLARGLARLDICCTGHEPEAAWATLDRLFERSMSSREQVEADGMDSAWNGVSLSLSAMGNARLALDNDFPKQANKWWQRADELYERHRQAIEQSPRLEELLTHMEAVRSELDWLKARNEDRHADAVVHALSARAKKLSWIEMNEVIASWQAAGGTEEGFEHLLKVWNLELPAKWRGWRRLDQPLAAFELTDLQERVWSLENLEGKRTLVNLWAVWCGPCLLELPKVQELHERFADDPDVQIVTVNLDAVEGVARELIRREGYDFPVLMHGKDKNAFEGVRIPRNWLVDGDGLRQWEQLGFGPEVADHWVGDVASLLEQME